MSLTGHVTSFRQPRATAGVPGAISQSSKQAAPRHWPGALLAVAPQWSDGPPPSRPKSCSGWLDLDDGLGVLKIDVNFMISPFTTHKFSSPSIKSSRHEPPQRVVALPPLARSASSVPSCHPPPPSSTVSFGCAGLRKLRYTTDRLADRCVNNPPPPATCSQPLLG